ncbi:MAG: penicillin-binding protein activator, partial [Hyphomicrobium sp.]
GNITGKPASTASVEQPAIGTSPETKLGDTKPQSSARVALLLPLSGFGETAQIARGMKQAAEMALFDANNPAIQLMVKDDGGTPEGAMAAADGAMAEGAEIILGPLFGKAATGAATAARRQSISVMSFSNDTSVAGNGVYLMSFLAADEISRVIAYAAAKGKRRFVALIPATPYGQTVEPAFRAAIATAGADLVAAEVYTPDATGMLASAKKILETIKTAERSGQPIDALFLPTGPGEIAQLGPLIAYSGLDTSKVKLIGTSAWDVPVTARDDILVGGWYAASDPAAWADFSQKFQKTFGRAPPRLATLAYDAMSYAIDLAGVPAPARYSAESLTRAAGFNGVDGPVRFEADGRARRALAVIEIEKYRSVVIDAAPRLDNAPARISSAAQVP